MTRNYTTVKEMTEEVNRMLELLEEVKGLAITLTKENVRNSYSIANGDKRALAEKRPITLIQRMNEADKYAEFFNGFKEQVDELINALGRNY